jgi:hypothetical protein
MSMASKKRRPSADPALKQLWEKFWKPLICDKRGRISKTKLMTELGDFSLLMQEASIVYRHVTGGRIHTPRALSSDVLAAANDADNEALQEILKDEREKWEAEPISADDVCYVALGGKTAAFPGRHARVMTPEGAFVVAWCSDTDQLFVDDTKPLPHTWRDTARDAIKALLEKTHA